MDREKQLRMHIGAQVVQLVEDAADLKAWTVSQVCGVGIGAAATAAGAPGVQPAAAAAGGPCDAATLFHALHCPPPAAYPPLVLPFTYTPLVALQHSCLGSSLMLSVLRPPPHPPTAQVDTIRGEMDEEVTRLLDTIRRKSAKLADTEARLTKRLRWGVAVLQAKNELGIKREVFRWWRWAGLGQAGLGDRQAAGPGGAGQRANEGLAGSVRPSEL